MLESKFDTRQEVSLKNTQVLFSNAAGHYVAVLGAMGCCMSSSLYVATFSLQQTIQTASFPAMDGSSLEIWSQTQAGSSCMYFFAGVASFSGSKGSRSCAFKPLTSDSSPMVSSLKQMLDTERRDVGHFFCERTGTVGQLWAEVSCSSLWQLGHKAGALVKGRGIISSYQPPSNHTPLTVTGANHIQPGRN